MNTGTACAYADAVHLLGPLGRTSESLAGLGRIAHPTLRIFFVSSMAPPLASVWPLCGGWLHFGLVHRLCHPVVCSRHVVGLLFSLPMAGGCSSPSSIWAGPH